MILARGKLYETNFQNQILERLQEEIESTRSTRCLTIQSVITAIDKLGQAIYAGEMNDTLQTLIKHAPQHYIDTLLPMLRRENIEYRLSVESVKSLYTIEDMDIDISLNTLKKTLMPLGTLLHIAAGNMDGLPAFSVVEGLLTGNVNILKLPQEDKGLSIQLLMKLIEIEPELADYIYVFDTPSRDIEAIKQMANISDGIVTWGGDQAVLSVRQYASPGCRLIEWGHKLSFAYISGFEDKKRELTDLAEHIMGTKQALCSSCQVIYLDTYDMAELYDFCNEFLPYLEEAAVKYPAQTIGSIAEITFKQYYQTLDAILGENKPREEYLFQGKGCSLSVFEDHKLELSPMFGNCLVKRLPQEDIFNELQKVKGYLQTVGLICDATKRKKLTEVFAKTGLVRIMRGGNLSTPFLGEAHDGEYPLRRYTRIVNIE